MERQNLIDIFLGGLGGAIVATLLTVFFSMYNESVRNKEFVRAGAEILNAKKQVIEEIRNARSEERKHLFSAIDSAADAKAQAEIALDEINKAKIEIKAQKDAIDDFYQRVQKGANVNINDLATILRPKITEALINTYNLTGGVLAFNLQECPNGWTPYEKAYGRFIRGIDKSGKGIDPDGKRPKGNIQEDLIGKHSHSANMEIGAEPTSGGAQASQAAGAHGRRGTNYTSNGLVNDFGGVETRPKNVSLLYCEKL